MRKDILLPSLALAGGVAGFFLRRWQLSCAYVPKTGLFTRGAPATLALLGLLAVLAAAFLLLVWNIKEGPDDFLPAFHSPEPGQMTVLAAAGLLLLAAGALGIRDGIAALQLWRAAPQVNPFSVPGSLLLAGGLCVLGGLGILLLGRMTYRNELNDAACRLSPFPAFAGLVWLFSSHLQNRTEPVLMKYGFTMAAILLLTLAHYFLAGFLFGRPRPRLTAFLCLMGAVLGIVSLADRPDLFTAAALLAYSLSALAFARALPRNTFGPAWRSRMPPPEEDPEPDGPNIQTED